MGEIYKNKGEWAELYLLYSILGSGQLIIRDPLENKPDKTMVIESIIRCCSKGLLEFVIDDSVVRISADGFFANIEQFEFMINAEKLKGELLTGKGAFQLSSKLIDFMKRCGIDQPKARSLPSIVNGVRVGGKCDILLRYVNPRTGNRVSAGFSIKSDFACPASLQNGSFQTNFEYDLLGLSLQNISKINSICLSRRRKSGEHAVDLFGRCMKIIELGADIVPMGLAKDKNGTSTFELNLGMVDSVLPTILSDVVQLHYFSDDHPTLLSEMPKALILHRPVYDKAYDKAFYKKKIKDYLYACFAGMVPTERWSGQNDVDGGYLIIDPQFEVSGCLSTDTDDFKEYLFQNTKLEHPDCSKSRSNYGTVLVRENGIPFIRLNLQIRFIGRRKAGI